jgi:hypothetical protein
MRGTEKARKNHQFFGQAHAVYRLEKSSAYKLNENLRHDIISPINPAIIRQIV